jgi:hypothetical protein
VLLIVLAVLVIAGSVGVFSLVRTNQIASDNAENPNPYPPNSGTLVLDDPLSQPLQWNDKSGSEYSCHFLGRAYHVKAQSSGGCESMSTYTSSITLEVQMTIIAGSCGEIDYLQANGDHFPNGTTEDYYNIGVCSDGSYFLYFHLSNSQETFGNNSFSSKFKSGLNQTNLIAMVATSHSLILYVNNKIIDTIQDDGINYSNSQNGNLYLGVQSQRDTTEVAFQNVRVWTL